MNKCLNWILSALLLASVVFPSCSEDDGAIDPFADWETRNQVFIDSVAVVARNNPSEWLTIHTYKFLPGTGQGLEGDLQTDVNSYVYCKVLKKGEGATPLFNDTVSVNYRGKLIPLLNGEEVVFDQSYQGDLKEEIAVPAIFNVNGVIEGWTTALQQMKEGDRWEVYIPSNLAYGSVHKPSIPGGSTLIFDMHLVEVKPLR